MKKIFTTLGVAAVTLIALAALVPLAGALLRMRNQKTDLQALVIHSIEKELQRVGIPREGVVGARPNHILVKFKPGVGRATRDDVRARHKLSQQTTIQALDIEIAAMPAGTSPENAVQDLLAADGARIEFAEVDALLAPSFIPDDPWFINWQKDKQLINASSAWDTATGLPTLTVAVADTGVDCTHEDLTARCVSPWNFYANTADAHDVVGHGTKVAGVIAAQGNNGVGVAGAAWNVQIMPLRVSDPQGYASYSAIANAISYAADHGAKVVNVSFQASGSRAVRSAGSYLRKKGGLVSVSAGNTGSPTGYAASQDLIIVSATDPNDVLYSWSSTGDDVDIAAPGCTGATTQNGGGYGSFCGTSNAAPEVAGVLMLVWSANPGLTADQAQNALFASAADLGAPGWDSAYGWGRADANAAVQYALQTITNAPSVQKLPPGKSK